MRHHNCVTTGLALRLWQVALSRFLSFAALLCLSLSFTAIPALGQSNPVPFVNQPLVPSAVAPGGPDFTLTVNGTGFVSGASEGTCPSCSIGGNGGSGAFGEAVLTVAPGASLTIVVGAGGAGGAVNTTNSGGSGGTTEIKDATGTVLLSAGGGSGGACGTCGATPGTGGATGVGPAGSLLHSGPGGGSCGGGPTRCGYLLPDFATDTDLGGRGFNNGNPNETETINGIFGYVYIEW